MSKPNFSLLSGAEEEFLDGWKRNGETIVFTNGCFDILHPGHVDILKKAKAHGGKLVVGLNSDESVRRLKGEGRPVIPAGLRKYFLSELRSVDLVIVFQEDTPLDLIQLIRPDVLVKGEDYKGREVVGRDIVESYGGRVELVPLLPGFSTTDLINKLKSAK